MILRSRTLCYHDQIKTEPAPDHVTPTVGFSSSSSSSSSSIDETEGVRVRAKRKVFACSSKLLLCDLERAALFVGAGLGKTKAEVMDWLLFRDFKQEKHLDDGDSFAPRISFNKMSGLTEWKNACVLWINLDDDMPYYNEFRLREGRVIVKWYGSASHRMESPAIIRLTDAESPTLLFCRMVGDGYINYGRLRCVKVNHDRSPICIYWELIDGERITGGFPQAVSSMVQSNELEEISSSLDCAFLR